MHKGDYHTDYSKYYDNEYKDKDLAFEHIKKLKEESRRDLEDSELKEQDNVAHRTEISSHGSSQEKSTGITSGHVQEDTKLVRKKIYVKKKEL